MLPVQGKRNFLRAGSRDSKRRLRARKNDSRATRFLKKEEREGEHRVRFRKGENLKAPGAWVEEA